MKKSLLLITMVATLFACSKPEAPAIKSAPPAFDHAAFQKELDEMSAIAVRKQTVKTDNARFLRFLKIFCADILGGLGGATSGAVFGTPGIIVGSVAGAVSGSIKAAESYSMSVNSPLPDRLPMANNYDLNGYVRIRPERENPYLYYGEFHNYALADLGTTFTGTEYHDEFNHGRILELIDADATFQPEHIALQAAGGEFTLANYRSTTDYFLMSDSTNTPLRVSAADPDAVYWSTAINKMKADGLISENIAGYYITFFTNLYYMNTNDATRSYMESFENRFLYNTTMPEEEKAAMLRSFAVARYSYSFWYTIMPY